MKLGGRLKLVWMLLSLPVLVLGPVAWALASQDPKPQVDQPQPSPEAKADDQDAGQEEAGEKEEQAKEEEFKEEEPKTASEKERKEEIERKACPKVDIKFSADTDKKSHPTPEPESGKALLYVLRPTMYGNKIQSKLGIDGQWVGLNRGRNYFFVQLDPGEHYLCSKSENRSTMALTVEAGKTYFVEQKVRMGFMKARTKLATMTDEKGREKLAKCHPSSWQQKK
jgi:hypothetical protein